MMNSYFRPGPQTQPQHHATDPGGTRLLPSSGIGYNTAEEPRAWSDKNGFPSRRHTEGSAAALVEHELGINNTVMKLPDLELDCTIDVQHESIDYVLHGGLRM